MEESPVEGSFPYSGDWQMYWLLQKLSAKKIVFLGLYYTIGQFLPTEFPFAIGNRLRRILFSSIFREFGVRSTVDRRVYIGLGCDISMGSHSWIGSRTKIFGIGGGGKVKIGNNVLIAPEVSILTTQHLFSDPEVPIVSQGVEGSTVTIEDDTFIGYRVIILPGITIGKGAIVGAGAIVTHDVAPYCIVGGVPARRIRARK